MPSHVEMNRQRMAIALATAAGRWADTAGRRVANAAREHCPVDEGRLRASITHTVTLTSATSAKVRIGSPLEYAKWVHEGTGIYGPHRTPIVPVSAKALKFKPGPMIGPLRAGQRRTSRRNTAFIFRASVRGSPPRPFLTQGLEDVFGTVNRRPT